MALQPTIQFTDHMALQLTIQFNRPHGTTTHNTI